MTKHALLLMTLAAAPCARAQMHSPAAFTADMRAAHGPVDVPGWPSADTPAAGGPELASDGRCQSVRAGDTVHFALKIDASEGAKIIFADLRMEAKGHRAHFRASELPLPRAGVLSGGGVGARDAADFSLYHFSFAVPEVEPGIYRAAAFSVRAAYPGAEPARVTMDRTAREQVRGYCLAVFGGSHGPVVTEFLPKPTEHTAAAQPAFALR